MTGEGGVKGVVKEGTQLSKAAADTAHVAAKKKQPGSRLLFNARLATTSPDIRQEHKRSSGGFRCSLFGGGFAKSIAEAFDTATHVIH